MSESTTIIKFTNPFCSEMTAERFSAVTQRGGAPFNAIMQDGRDMKVPEFLIEMSKQMNEQPTRMTAHPFWQVRCKRYLVTEEGYNEHHWEIVSDEGVVFRSDKNDLANLTEYLEENHEGWFSNYLAENEIYDEETHQAFADSFDPDCECDSLPEPLKRVFVQEVEEVVSTHFTEADANWFIQRKQHDYPKLYTYVESAYWSPQIKQLQDWIKSLTSQSSIM